MSEGGGGEGRNKCTMGGGKGLMREEWREEGKESKAKRGQECGRKNWREGRNE